MSTSPVTGNARGDLVHPPDPDRHLYLRHADQLQDGRGDHQRWRTRRKDESLTEAGEKDAIMTVARNIVDAWNRHEMDAFAKIFAEDSDFVVAG